MGLRALIKIGRPQPFSLLSFLSLFVRIMFTHGLCALAWQVDHVIMFDFPKTVTDYLHRAGRTGRMGRPGRVTSLYSTKDVALAQKIEVCTVLFL